MHHELLAELSAGWSTDNALAAMAIRAGEPVDSAELIELASGAKTLFSLTTLVGRGSDRIADHHHLWAEVAETFRKALSAWNDLDEVSTSTDPILHAYLKQLGRLGELATARVDLYSVTQSERETFTHRFRRDSGGNQGEESERSEEVHHGLRTDSITDLNFPQGILGFGLRRSRGSGPQP